MSEYTVTREQYRAGVLIASVDFVGSDNLLPINDELGIIASEGHNDLFVATNEQYGKERRWEWSLEWHDDRIYVRRKEGDWLYARFANSALMSGYTFYCDQPEIGYTIKDFWGYSLSEYDERTKAQASTGEIVGREPFANCYLVRVDDSLGRWLLVNAYDNVLVLRQVSAVLKREEESKIIDWTQVEQWRAL